MRSFVAAFLLVLVPGTAWSKCAAGWIELSGQVTDASGKPLAGAAVGLAWVVDGRARGPALAVTDASGRYSIPIEYATDSGMSITGEDRCDLALGEVSVAASTRTHQSRDLWVPIPRSGHAQLPTLVVDKPISRRPLWPDPQARNSTR